MEEKLAEALRSLIEIAREGLGYISAHYDSSEADHRRTAEDMKKIEHAERVLTEHDGRR